MSNESATNPAPAALSPSPLDAVDQFMARALAGRVSFAELLVLTAVASAELRKSDERLAGSAS